jgi:hypothetical protein
MQSRTFNRRNGRWLTGTIILLASAGIVFFGIRAVLENRKRPAENPFAYQMDRIEMDDVGLAHYQEEPPLPVPVEEPTGLAVSREGILFVCGKDEMIRISPGGEAYRTALPFEASCIAAGHGVLYLGAGDHVEVCTENGEPKAGWASPGEKSIITSISAGHDVVYAADAGYKRVWKYDTDGTLLAAVGQQDSLRDIPGFLIPSPYFDVAVDPDGFLWAANTGRHSVENYTHDGGMRSSWGRYGNAVSEFCGCCNPAHFTILKDGSFVTSEKGVPRVKVYDRTGRLSAVVAGAEKFPGTNAGHDITAHKGRIYILESQLRRVRRFSIPVSR